MTSPCDILPKEVRVKCFENVEKVNDAAFMTIIGSGLSAIPGIGAGTVVGIISSAINPSLLIPSTLITAGGITLTGTIYSARRILSETKDDRDRRVEEYIEKHGL